MNNLLRTLIYGEQVSLTVADTTAIVCEGIRLHKLTPASARVFGKALSALAFISACLKEERGEVSISLQSDGECIDIGASGNRALRLRGYIGNSSIEGLADSECERRALGSVATLTVIRDDGYSRPFVGACALPQNADLDGGLEEYYRISEQLPTRIKTVVELDEEGNCAFAGVVALQSLPFATDEVLAQVEYADLERALALLKTQGIEKTAREYFAAEEELELREAVYQCNCSREYLSSVLVTLGEGQLREIISSEGAVRVHCHYCNRDYEFRDEDVDELFKK